MVNNKKTAVFLDRDGVLNIDHVTYSYDNDTFQLIPLAMEALKKLKEMGYTLIIITNQSGIAKGVYTEEAVHDCHQKIQEACNHAIDGLYFSPYHPDHDSRSLGRKPGRLLFEKAAAKYDIDFGKSFMVGDKERDLLPAKELGIAHRVLVDVHGLEAPSATHLVKSLWEGVEEGIFKK